MEYFKGKIVLALDNDLKAFGLLKIKIWGNVITFRCNIFSKRTKKKKMPGWSKTYKLSGWLVLFSQEPGILHDGLAESL